MTINPISFFQNIPSMNVQNAPTVKAEEVNTAFQMLSKNEKVDSETQFPAAFTHNQAATPQTQVDTQIIAQDPGEAAKAEFLDFMSQSPEERMRALLLKQLGVTEEQLAAMSPEEREKIEQKIREKITEEIERKTGVLASNSLNPSISA